MAGHVARNWNTILPSMLMVYRKLEELGFASEIDAPP